MKQLAILAVLALAGCGWDMDVGAWTRAQRACQDHGGVLAADHMALSNYVYARCVDGTQLGAP